MKEYILCERLTNRSETTVLPDGTAVGTATETPSLSDRINHTAKKLKDALDKRAKGKMSTTEGLN